MIPLASTVLFLMVSQTTQIPSNQFGGLPPTLLRCVDCASPESKRQESNKRHLIFGYVHALRTFALSGSSLLWTWTLPYCEIDLVGGKWGELLAHPNLQVHKCPVPNQHSWRSLSDNQDTSSHLGLPQETRSCQRCRIRTKSDWKCQRLIVA